MGVHWTALQILYHSSWYVSDPASSHRQLRVQKLTQALTGLRIMAFGVLFDFTGNVNVTRTTTTADMLRKDWFLDAIKKDIDVFLILGHNPAREGRRGSTFRVIHDFIRTFHPDTPIHFFGENRQLAFGAGTAS